MNEAIEGLVSIEGNVMRVVLNALSTLKPKTGVGHYAARLAAGLPGVTVFPEPGLAKYLRKSGGGRPGASPWWRDAAKRAGWRALETLFRFRYRGYDLYHEPNFLPFDCGLPTVVTVRSGVTVRSPHALHSRYRYTISPPDFGRRVR